MLMHMDNNPSTKNIVVVQDITNGLGHIIKSETSGGIGRKAPTLTWDVAEQGNIRLTQLCDPSMYPDRKPSESESQIKK